jgi:hypothetical protein
MIAIMSGNPLPKKIRPK